MQLWRTFFQPSALLLTLALLPTFAVSVQAQRAIDKIRPALVRRMQAAAAVMRQEGAPRPLHRIIVGLKPSLTTLPSDSRPRIRALQEAVFNAPIQGTLKVRHRYQTLHGFSAEADGVAIGDLAKQDAVEAIYLMPVFRASAIESHPLTATDEVHRAGFTGKGITIAVIDDGIDHDHLVFGRLRDWPNAKILDGYDFADDDDDPRIDCNEQDHGTAVAGVAAGDGLSVTGTAPDATLVFLKVERSADCGQGIYRGDVVGALEWVLRHHLEYNIKVVSMSFGFGAFDNADICDTDPDIPRPYVEAIDQLDAAGITIFAASGNEGLCTQIEYPACMSKVISVGSVFDDDIDPQTYCISSATCEAGTAGSCGENRQVCSHDQPEADLVPCYVNSAGILDILAPADCARTASVQRGTTESCFRGTSFATPFAAGVAATLLEAIDGSLDPSIMKRMLTSTGVQVLDARNTLLKPRIHTYAALHALLDEVTPCPDCPRHTGNLTHPGTMVLPAPPFRSPAGLHQGWVLGTMGTDVNLYLLQKWFGVWQIVAGATSSTAIESIRFNGQAGEYVWAVQLHRGSGAYDFWFMQP
ncbi:S8 family serine peptidase [Candidatus Entotheonella palauensis]|uniref:S8 family serine peptidase n=1 Tax=Candidatus Entotheonella palauensis TaxID=93172 RepID=UPI000B7C62D6|nr:S8 family serine peptidase [Candidatus Entotheonella palauensis]